MPTNPIKTMYTKEYKTLIREAHEKCSEWLDSSGALKSRTLPPTASSFVKYYLHNRSQNILNNIFYFDFVSNDLKHLTRILN